LSYDIEAEDYDVASEIVEAVSSLDTISALEDQIMEITGSTVNVTSSFGTFTMPEEEEEEEEEWWKGFEVWLVAAIALICFMYILLLVICMYRKRSKDNAVAGDDTKITAATHDEEQKTTDLAGSTNVDESKHEPETSRTLLGASPTAQNIESAD
jgi:flagellar biosynthesis/type III secretory pathway M-ring protein FliF/YscJ